MSLGIEVYDMIDNKLLNKGGVPFAILSDDSINVIKEKIFCLMGNDNEEDSYIKYYPNFVKVVDDSGKRVELCEKSSMNKIYISSIVDDIKNKGSSIVDLYLNLDTDIFYDLYDKLKVEYEELMEEDLIFVVKYNLLRELSDDDDSMLNQITLIEPGIDNIITDYVDTIKRKRLDMKKGHMNIQKSLSEFYDLVYKTQEFPEINNIKYTGVVLSLGDRSSKKFIKLSQIFNVFELSKEMPFIALANKEGDPMVKIYNDILNMLSEKEMKSWILNEKKKLNQTSYKKIKGLMIKYKINNTFLTLNLMENGYMNIKINFADNEVKMLDEIIDIMKLGVNNIISYINSLGGIFSKSQKLKVVENIYKIESVTAVVETTKLIDMETLKGVLFKTGYSDIFAMKDTKSQEMVSMYYKKMCKMNVEDMETKGITVTVRNNPYKLDSSLINVYSALNISSIERIAKMLILMTKTKARKKYINPIVAHLVDTEKGEQKITSKANIKMIREQGGVNLSSKKCQKQRQPKVLNGSMEYKLAKDDSYLLEFKGNKYLCPNIEYPYPGFIGDNLPCCFNKPQRHTEKYIRNMHPELNDILVRPSNFKVDITKDNVTFETYVIKVVSDYMPMMNERNSLPRYYYISEEKDLVPIKNDDLVSRLEILENEKEIWLNEVSLATLVFEPPKNKCNNTPNMEIKSDINLNAPCEHHEKNKIFGYNQNSFPCCFANRLDPYVKRVKKVDDTKVKDYILQQDKILNPEKIGILPPNIDNIFNNLSNRDANTKFYKRGVLTGQSLHSSFINAVLYGSNYRIKNANDFIKYIIEYLDTNPDEFQKLNGGDIARKYGSLKGFIKNISDSSWYDLLDITQRLVGCNILVINIPYIPNKLELDYKNTRLHCAYNIKMDNRYPYIILIKKKNTFENVIEMDKGKNIVAYNFKYDSSSNIKENVVNFLLDFYESTCIKEDIFPENFKYDKLYTNDELHNFIKDTAVKIKFQLLNEYNKVNMVVTDNNVILPIKQNGIKDYAPFMSVEEYLKDNLLTLEEYIRGITLINKYIPNPINILGVTIEDNKYTAVQTNFGILIPVKPSVRGDLLFTYPILNFKYYSNVDKKYKLDVIDSDIEYKLGSIIFNDDKVIKYVRQKVVNKEMSEDEKIDEMVKLFKKIKGHFYDKDNFNEDKLKAIAKKYIINMSMVYSDIMRGMKDKIYKIKQQLASVISVNEDLINRIKGLNKKSDMNRVEKVNKTIDIFKNIMDENTSEFILKHIANEVINDNIENALLNNMIVPDEFNVDEITMKESESVLLNIEDIKNWVKKYKNVEDEDEYVDVEE